MRALLAARDAAPGCKSSRPQWQHGFYDGLTSCGIDLPRLVVGNNTVLLSVVPRAVLDTPVSTVMGRLYLSSLPWRSPVGGDTDCHHLARTTPTPPSYIASTTRDHLSRCSPAHRARCHPSIAVVDRRPMDIAPRILLANGNQKLRCRRHRMCFFWRRTPRRRRTGRGEGGADEEDLG
jgi:hypothetical protein